MFDGLRDLLRDPLGGRARALFGFDVVESPDLPRYQMPEWLVPPSAEHDGVRWDPAFRAETNRWALEVLGTTNMVPQGHGFVIGGTTVLLRPADAAKLAAACVRS